MDKKFSIKHIAAQASVSPATVDRVLNDRSGVSLHTRQRVLNAVDELEKYYTKISLSGRQTYIDIIVHQHYGEGSEIKDSVAKVLPLMKSFSINPRIHYFLDESPVEIAQKIDHIVDMGTSGLVVTAPDEFAIRDSINRAYQTGVPTVTLDSDIPYSERIHFVGARHFSDGQSAAYLMGQWLKHSKKRILLPILSTNFFSQVEREAGFRQLMRQRHPDCEVDVLDCGSGEYQQILDRVIQYLEVHTEVNAVYSIAGDNSAIKTAFDKAEKSIEFFMSHNLNQVNKSLLLNDSLNIVFDHNLEQSVYQSFLVILEFYRYVQPVQPVLLNQTSIITAFNLHQKENLSACDVTSAVMGGVRAVHA